MNKKNEELSTAQFKNVPTRRAEITIRFDVPEEEATSEYMNAMAATAGGITRLPAGLGQCGGGQANAVGRAGGAAAGGGKGTRAVEAAGIDGCL